MPPAPTERRLSHFPHHYLPAGLATSAFIPDRRFSFAISSAVVFEGSYGIAATPFDDAFITGNRLTSARTNDNRRCRPVPKSM
jgi:hypothetical protein